MMRDGSAKRSTQPDARPPAAVAPLYRMEEANDRIPLYKGPMTFRGQCEAVEGDGTVCLEWLPSPRIEFDMASTSGWHDLGAGDLVLPALKRVNPGHVSRFRCSSEGRCHVKGFLHDETGSSIRVNSVTAHLCNFPSYVGERVERPDSWERARLVICDDVWEICLDSTSTEKKANESARASRGFAITHVCDIRRRDGGDFLLPGPLDPLFRFLSFAAGRWCGLCLPVGFDTDGKRVVDLWSVQKTTPHTGASAWLPHLEPQPYADSYGRFRELWNTPEGRRVLRLGIGWYVHAMSMGELEARLVQALAGLELLAYFGLVHWPSPKIWSEATYGGIGSTDGRIRALLEHCAIPGDVPSQLASCRRLMKESHDWKNSDGPEMIWWIRNSIVHPIPRLPLTTELMWEALELALQYMELSILRFLDYSGCYLNRIGPLGGTEWRGKRELVPWVA